MKNKISIFIAVVIVALSCMNCVCAQDWAELDAKKVNTLVDTTYMRASEVTIMPKEKGGVHTHPAHFFYALTDCNLVVHYTDGSNENYNLKAGDNGYSAPEKPHWTENVSDKAAKFLLVELKEHPYNMNTKK